MSRRKKRGARRDTSVKATVRRMLVQYPGLFQDKGDCFNQLFLVIGNGYEWDGGCLIETARQYDDDEPRWADEDGKRDGDIGDVGDSEIDAMIMRQRILWAKTENNRIRFVLENFEAMFEGPVMALRCVYPVCDYSLLFNMPKDVRPDWRAACDETSRLLNAWLISQNRRQEIHNLGRAAKLNAEFRAKHFAKKDAEMRELFKSILDEAESAQCSAS